MDINSKLEKYKDLIESHSQVTVDVDIDFAESIGVKILNDEIDSSDVDLFSNEKNSKIAMAILKA